MDETGTVVVITYKRNWSITRTNDLIAIGHNNKRIMVLSRTFYDLAELGFHVTDSGDFQISMLGQPVMILFGREK